MLTDVTNIQIVLQREIFALKMATAKILVNQPKIVPKRKTLKKFAKMDFAITSELVVTQILIVQKVCLNSKS